jgi:D-amino peptidase
MRVLIMADMEGVSGIVNWDQVNGGAPLYEECRRLYTHEVNAAVRGARAAGATEVVAVDCHGAGGGWNFNSFIPELMDDGCDWVSGHVWSRYTELLERGADCCVLVGMHAKADTPDGVLCHTISTTKWRNLWFNDTSVGEVGINAALCGHYGCPVAFVSGDEATCRESAELLGDGLTTAAVKRGLSRYAARHIAPARARQMIESGVRSALAARRWARPFVPAKPTTITIELGTVDHAAAFRGRSGVDVIAPVKVVSRADDWMTAWNQVWPWA